MANPAINFAGFLYDDSGDAVSGATINLYDKNTSTTSRASTTTNSSGYWTIAHTTAGEFDVQITSGSSKRRIKFDDKIHLSEVDTEVLNVRGNNGAAAPLYFFSDQGDDAGDRWLFNAAAGGVFTMGNDLQSQGTYVAHVTITPNATVANSTFAVAGNLTVGNALTVTGTTTLNGSLVLGDAAADTPTVGATLQGASPLTFEGGTSDGYETTFAITDPTADRTITFPNLSGTVQLSGNPITGTTIDASTDFTIGNTVITDGVITDSTGLQLAANLDIDGTVDISGDLTLSAGGDGALVFGTAGENSIKIPDNQASALIIEEANNAYITFTTTDSSEAITVAKPTTFSGALDINAAVDISGDLTLSAGGDGALVFATAGENSIKIPDNQGSALIIEEANNAYMTFVTTDSSEAVSVAKTLTLSTVAAAGTDTDKFLVLDSSGNVDYRTGTEVLSDIGGGTGGMTSFQLEDDDGTEVAISNAKEVKIIGSGVTTNWTDTDNGTDGDPYDLTITVDAAQTGITSVYNASLKLGRDADNLVDFATTDNKIIFRVEGVDEVELVQNALSPVTASGVDLGTASLEWGNIYIGDDKKIYLGTGSDASIEYDEDGTDQLRIAGNTIFENQVELAKDLLLDPTPADTVWSGVTAKFTAGEDLEDGECVYLKAADTKMWKAVANTGGTGLITPDIMCVAMCVADVDADAVGTFLLQGFLRADTNFPTYAVGETLYVPEAETSGKNVPEGAIPDSDGDFVQVIGWAADANTVYFNPDFTIIEHA